MRLYLPLGVVLLSFLFGLPAQATTYVVKPNGSGDFPTIQAAVDAALDGDIVVLTKGTFVGEGNRDVDFRGKAITIRSRSGQAKHCTIDIGGTPESPHRAFKFISGEGPASILEGITMTGGYAPPGPTIPAGGAVLCYQSSPTIRQCRFVNNYSSLACGAVNGNGSSMRIDDCYFSGNRGDGERAPSEPQAAGRQRSRAAYSRTTVQM